MGLRKATLWIEPSQTLTALHSLLQCKEHLSVSFAAVLTDEMASQQNAITTLSNCLWWLHEVKVFQVSRATRQKWIRWQQSSPMAVLSALAGSLAISLEAITKSVASGDENAKVTSVAIRTILSAVKQDTLLHAADYRMGPKSLSISQFADTMTEHLLQSEKTASKKKPKQKPIEAPAAKPTSEAKAKPNVATQSKPSKPSKVPTPKAAPVKPTKRAKPPKATSFGGLPDDAQPTNKIETVEALSPRGLSLDAEFFLEQAKIPWPSPMELIERARKLVLARLHPDRAGAESAGSFHRAMRGVQSLFQQLNNKSHEAPAVEPKKSRESSGGEWPPRTATTGRR